MLQRALNTIFDVYRVREPDFLRDFHEALKAGKIPNVDPGQLPKGITRNTIINWRKSPTTREWDYVRARAVFNFIETSDRYQTEHVNKLGLNAGNDETARLIYSMGSFLSHERTIPYRSLYELQGERFAMFRQAWFRPNTDLYIRSIVQFKRRNDVLVYTEHQEYEDAEKGLSIAEDDEGFVFAYGASVMVFSKEVNGACVKFLTADYFKPDFGNPRGVQEIRGHLIAVSGRHNAPPFRFIMKRIKNRDYESAIIKEDILDNDDLKYLKSGA